MLCFVLVLVLFCLFSKGSRQNGTLEDLKCHWISFILLFLVTSILGLYVTVNFADKSHYWLISNSSYDAPLVFWYNALQTVINQLKRETQNLNIDHYTASRQHCCRDACYVGFKFILSKHQIYIRYFELWELQLAYWSLTLAPIFFSFSLV